LGEDLKNKEFEKLSMNEKFQLLKEKEARLQELIKEAGLDERMF
jgi:hypothetical protein